MTTTVSAERRIWLARALLVLGGVAALWFTGWGDIPWWGLALLAVASAVTVRLPGRIAIGRQGVAFALNDAVLAIALVFTLSGSVALVIPLGYIAAVVRKRPWVKVSYNAAAQFFAVAVG